MTRTKKVRVEALYVYPIKSCRGHSLTSAKLTPWGLEHDRRYMIVDSEGVFFTQRKAPRLALISSSLPTDAGITLQGATDSEGAPVDELFVSIVCADSSSSRLYKVWDDMVPGVDQGDGAAEWLQKFVGTKGLRLVRIDESAHRQLDPQFGVGETGFADGFPVLVTSQASVDDISRRAKAPEITVDRFRTNVHISGCSAFEEDDLLALSFHDAKTKLALIKPCARCSIPGIQQNTGVRPPGGEPRKTLATYRRGAVLQRTARLHRAFLSLPINDDEVFFGQNALVEFNPGAVLRVGDIGIVER